MRVCVCVCVCIQWLDDDKMFKNEDGDEELEGGFAVAMRAYERAFDWVLKVRGLQTRPVEV